jgi:protein TonB
MKKLFFFFAAAMMAGSMMAQTPAQNDSIDNEIVEFTVVEQMPEFPGGQNALIQYLSQNIRYPLIAKENKIQGRTLVSFVVEKDGKISNVQVLRSSGDMMLDREAMRVIRSMPRWRPGYMKGQPVRAEISYCTWNPEEGN